MMPFIGSILPANLFGPDPNERARREKERRRVEPTTKGSERTDEVELSAVEEIGAVEPGHALGSVDSEEHREDRQRQGLYGPGGGGAGGGDVERGKRVDLEG